MTVRDTKKTGEITKITHNRQAIQSVFGGFVEEGLDTYVVYPSHPSVGLQDQDRNAIKWEFTEKEKRVTTIVGAHAIARLQSLLQIGGKSRRLLHARPRELRRNQAPSVVVSGPSIYITQPALSGGFPGSTGGRTIRKGRAMTHKQTNRREALRSFQTVLDGTPSTVC